MSKATDIPTDHWADSEGEKEKKEKGEYGDVPVPDIKSDLAHLFIHCQWSIHLPSQCVFPLGAPTSPIPGKFC